MFYLDLDCPDLGCFPLTGIAGFASVVFVVDCWNARRRRAILAMQYTVADQETIWRRGYHILQNRDF